MAQCTAKSKQSGERCKRPAALGYTVCSTHGGKTPRGLALPQTKEGRYSKVLPLRMAARYEEAQRDGELLGLREEIALTDARLADLLARVDSGESGALWGALQAARVEVLAAKRTGDVAAQAEAVNDLLRLVGQGHSDYQAWREVGAVLEQRRRLVESERKRLVEMQQMITTERAMVLLGAVVRVIQENVSDRGTLANITEGIQRLITVDAAD